MSATKLYLVVGAAGDYEDRREWVVGWSQSANFAHDYAAALQKAAAELDHMTSIDRTALEEGAQNAGLEDWQVVVALKDQLKAVDPQYDGDHGATYSSQCVERLGDLPDVAGTIDVAKAVATARALAAAKEANRA
jgi:hypothetical protein